LEICGVSRFPKPFATYSTAILIAFLVSSAGATASLRSTCLRLFDDVTNIETNVGRTLTETDDFDQLLGRLEANVTPHSRQPFIVLYESSDGMAGSFTPASSELKSAKLSISRNPRFPIPPNGKVIYSPSFGYQLGDGFRRLGPLKYIVLDGANAISEVGAGTSEAMTEFVRHLEGVTLTDSELRRISELNGKLLDALRRDPASHKKLLEFAAARKWPPGLEEDGKLAYFDPGLFSIDVWAKNNGFNSLDLVDAGWYRIDFSRDGRPHFILNSPDSIKIPYLPEKGNSGVPIWRSRNLAKKGNLPKYTGWQIDRSIDRRLTVAERLYNGGKLGSVKGKRIVITEGEFKCLVAEKLTKIPMFGIPGITEFDDDMVKALVEAEASEYVVILDRDPHVKALFRADEVTDSNRAAYALAAALERLGAKNVRVGTLPEMRSGEKLGIDDLAIKYGVDPIQKTIDEALPAQDYARSIGLDTKFQELMRRRSRLRKSLENYVAINRRTKIGVDAKLVENTRSHLARINRTFEEYLENELNGARTLGSASGKANSIRATTVIPEAASKRVRLSSGASVDTKTFLNDVLLLDYVPSDLFWADCRPALCGQVPFERNDLLAVFHGETPTGGLLAALEKGKEIALETGFEPQTFEEFSQMIVVGELTRNIPFDEYRFEFGVNLVNSASGTSTKLPVTVFKRDSGRAVAIVNLHVSTGAKYWESHERDFDSMLEFLRGSTRK
jgi:hypothetical protein